MELEKALDLCLRFADTIAQKLEMDNTFATTPEREIVFDESLAAGRHPLREIHFRDVSVLSFLGRCVQPNDCVGLGILSQTLLDLLDRSLKFVNGFGFRSQVASIDVSNYFQAETACAPNPVGSQSGQHFATIGTPELSQLLERLRYPSDVFYRVAIFAHQVKVDILAS
jgi:hypothetical protein